MIHNNCLDFGDALCDALGVGPLPRRAGVSVHSKASADLRCSFKQLGLQTLADGLFSFFGLVEPPTSAPMSVRPMCRPCEAENEDVLNMLIPAPECEATHSREPSLELEIAMGLAQDRLHGFPQTFAAAPTAVVKPWYHQPSVGTWLTHRGPQRRNDDLGSKEARVLQRARDGKADLVDFTKVLSAYGKTHRWSATLHGLTALDSSTLSADTYTINAAAAACRQWPWTLEVLQGIGKRRLQVDQFSCGVTMSALKRGAKTSIAGDLLAEYRKQSIQLGEQSYNIVISAYADENRWPEAVALLSQLRPSSLEVQDFARTFCVTQQMPWSLGLALVSNGGDEAFRNTIPWAPSCIVAQWGKLEKISRGAAARSPWPTGRPRRRAQCCGTPRGAGHGSGGPAGRLRHGGSLRCGAGTLRRGEELDVGHGIDGDDANEDAEARLSMSVLNDGCRWCNCLAAGADNL
eukprot:symbB.v1.2.030986.t1/scaffold3546.1/size54311/4